MGGRWTPEGDAIVWKTDGMRLPHADDIEMSGRGISYIVRYGTSDDGRLMLQRHCVWPSLRKVPNDTGGSFQETIPDDFSPHFYTGGIEMAEYPQEFRIDGILTIRSMTDAGVGIRRQCFPSAMKRNAYEIITLTNRCGSGLAIEVRGKTGAVTFGRGCKGVYIVESSWSVGEDSFTLESGGECRIGVCFSARTADREREAADPGEELRSRTERIAELTEPLVLETDDKVLDLMFRFAKIRAGESIFDTRAGLLHSPGGYSYYAATWCNDQIEYAGPWFAFTGDPAGIEASRNACRQYRPFMGPEYHPIPSSIISEGADFWEGAGDRGDAAMYAYGASFFSLISGNRDILDECWPGIEWCIEYCRRMTNADGIVASQSDELEGRFPSGDANLSTSSLYHGGLRYGALAAEALGKRETAAAWRLRADRLKHAVERHFGATIHGFETYRYFKGNDPLRSWICLPVCMGIDQRKNGTMEALFSKYLWTKDGLLTCEGTSTVWDRSTLYGLKAAFLSGCSGTALQHLKEYSHTRLLGERVPYAVEAWPEGGRRHLSAESALYCRTVAEGLFGIDPLGMDRFRFASRLPDGMESMKLRNIRAFGRNFDIEIEPGFSRVSAEGRTIWQGKSEGFADVRLP